MNAVINANYYDFHSYAEHSYVIFDSVIRSIGPMSDFPRAAADFGLNAEQVFDAEGRLMLPSLAVCHTHIYSTFSRGMNLPFAPEDFRQLLEQLWWKLDGELDGELSYASAQVSALGYLKSGVSAIIDHHASGRQILGSLDRLKQAVVDEAGLSAMFCYETSDRFDVDQCIQENIDFSDRAKLSAQEAQSTDPLWGGHFGLHASMTLSDATLEKVAKVLDQRPIHIHVAESELDERECRQQHGMSVIKRLDSFGLISPNSLIAHGIYLDDEEMDIIAKRGAWVVVNPSSNMNNGVGLPDVVKMMDKGIPVLLGNDGMSASIVDEWRSLYLGLHHRYGDPTAFGMDRLLEVIRNGYDYFQRMLGVTLGRIEPGYRSDFLLVDYDAPTPMGVANAMGHILFGMSSAFRPSYFWIGGTMKLADYRLKSDDLVVDEARVASKGRELSAELWQRLGHR